MNSESTRVSCIILAGGQGKRVGGSDKGLILYNNKSLIEHVFDAIKPQVDDIVISANRNIDSYRQYAKQVIHDSSENYRGPLAGINACLSYCKHELVLVVACDMPNLPGNLVERLTKNLQNNSICIATVKNYHQLAMIVRKNRSGSIKQHLDDNQLKLIQWVESVPYNTVSFDDESAAFINLNKLN